MQQLDNRYGFFGWKEFHSTRRQILDEVNRSKSVNVSRPVRTEHGVAGEAAFRNWLSSFLPKKFGVTSGYIIPDVILDGYKLYHFDTIVYDELNAPVLWTDGDFDRSEQGRRAIPAKHVIAVFETKASLTSQSATDGIFKLGELNEIQTHLPSQFSSAVVFFELAASLAEDGDILPRMIPSVPVVGYWGGMVLHCSLDPEMTGLIDYMNSPFSAEEAVDMATPIARDLREVQVGRDGSGNVVLRDLGVGVEAIGGPDGKWHFSKQFAAMVEQGGKGAMLRWSHNGFATFALDLLSRLEGISPLKRKYVFGQVFDEIT